jgi:hypothetical protein
MKFKHRVTTKVRKQFKHKDNIRIGIGTKENFKNS